MTLNVADPRLARIADRPTCRLTHDGRKTGRPDEVTIWFVVDRDHLLITMARASREWIRNVQALPDDDLRRRRTDRRHGGAAARPGRRAARDGISSSRTTGT